jgi:hypothetical protein
MYGLRQSTERIKPPTGQIVAFAQTSVKTFLHTPSKH